MALHSEDISKFKSSLEKSGQPASKAEVAAFKSKLKTLSLSGLRQQLDKRVIARPWKRDLAEAEIDQRNAAESRDDADAADDAARAKTKKFSVGRLLWSIAATVLIAASVAIIGYTGFMIWTM